MVKPYSVASIKISGVRNNSFVKISSCLWFQMKMVITSFMEMMAKQHLCPHFLQQETQSRWKPWRTCQKLHASCGAWRRNVLTLNTHQELEFASWRGLQNSLVTVQSRQDINNFQDNAAKFWWLKKCVSQIKHI